MIARLIKFALVGLSGVGVNMAVYMYLNALGMNYLVAAGCSFGIAVTNNFIWNVLWTFKGCAENKSIQKKYVTFFAVSVMNLGVNLFILQLLVGYLQISEIIAQFLAIAVVSGLNFILNYLITFSEKPSNQKTEAPAIYETNYYTDLQ